MEFGKSKNIVDDLKKYDYSAKDGDYISVTEWSNGEGYDIDLNGKQFFHLTNDELDAIKYITMAINYERDKFKTE